jgi:hypothetical protein
MTASYPFHHPNSVHIRHPRLLLTPNKRAFAVREKPSLRPFEKGSKLRPRTIYSAVAQNPPEQRQGTDPRGPSPIPHRRNRGLGRQGRSRRNAVCFSMIFVNMLKSRNMATKTSPASHEREKKTTHMSSSLTSPVPNTLPQRPPSPSSSRKSSCMAARKLALSGKTALPMLRTGTRR